MVYNPATGGAIAEVAQAGPQRTVEAVAAAHAAFSGWSALTAGERAQYFFAIATAMRADVSRLAEVLTSEQGKPLAEAKADRELCRLLPVVRRRGQTGVRRYPRFQSRQTPFYLAPPGRSHRGDYPPGSLLAVGCTTILKPASATPLSALEMASALCESGAAGRSGQCLGRSRRPHRRHPARGSPGAEALFHWFHRGRAKSDAKGEAGPEASVFRVGRARPGHRARRCASRPSGRRGLSGQIPQPRPVLHRCGRKR